MAKDRYIRCDTCKFYHGGVIEGHCLFDKKWWQRFITLGVPIVNSFGRCEQHSAKYKELLERNYFD
ncbi:MAG: hypothetical protein ACRC0G_09715 [Fusobacteriaceae bacterium]